MARITVCVTNDLTFDQRMIRCCNTLANSGHQVTLVGRELQHSIPLVDKSFAQVRLVCKVNSGPFFYAEYNRRLRRYLTDNPPDLAISCDLDTLLAVSLAAETKKFPFLYDSHEYFTEVPELEGRGWVKSVWSRIGRYGVPRAAHCYTVGPMLAEVLAEKYGVQFGVVRNVPVTSSNNRLPLTDRKPWILYQGALNAGRGLEQMIASMQRIDGLKLVLAGEGDLSAALRRQVEQSGLESKVEFLGRIDPASLVTLTGQAMIGINLLERRSESYYYSLANKFFDYIHAATPSVNMNFPEYARVTSTYPVSYKIDSLKVEAIVEAIRHLRDSANWNQMSDACVPAAEEYRWDKEEATLLGFVYSVLRGNTR